MHVGSLDAHVRRTVEEHGLEAAAREDLDIMLWMPAPRDWWRLAYTPEGDLVGLTLPSRNAYDPVVGYIAVVPEQRGHGYAYDLVVEATHDLVGVRRRADRRGHRRRQRPDGQGVREGRLPGDAAPHRPGVTPRGGRVLPGAAAARYRR